MQVVAKFVVERIVHTLHAHNYVQDEVVLRPDISSGNEDWSKYTPSGELRMVITNPSALAQFIPGDTFLLTFDKQEKETK